MAASTMAPAVVARGCRWQRRLGGPRGVAGLERDCRLGSLRPRRSHAQAGRRGDGRRVARRPLRFGLLSEHQPAAREELEIFRPPATREQRHGLAATRGDEEPHGRLGLAVLHARDGQHHARVGRDEAVAEAVCQFQALFCSRDRRNHLATVDVDERPVHEVPRESLIVAGEARGLDRPVQQLACLQQPALDADRGGRRLRQHRQEEALTGCACNGQPSPAVCRRLRRRDPCTARRRRGRRWNRGGARACRRAWHRRERRPPSESASASSSAPSKAHARASAASAAAISGSSRERPRDLQCTLSPIPRVGAGAAGRRHPSRA